MPGKTRASEAFPVTGISEEVLSSAPLFLKTLLPEGSSVALRENKQGQECIPSRKKNF